MIENMDKDMDKAYAGGDDLTEDEEIYKENILDHYKHPQNKGGLDPCDIRHHEHNPVCGDRIEIFIRLDQGRVADVRFDGAGCAISQASASMLTNKIKGMTIGEMKEIGREDIFAMLGIRIGVVRQKCALLSLKTLHNGMEKNNVIHQR